MQARDRIDWPAFTLWRDIISAKPSTISAISRELSTHAKQTKEANTFSGS